MLSSCIGVLQRSNQPDVHILTYLKELARDCGGLTDQKSDGIVLKSCSFHLKHLLAEFPLPGQLVFLY